MDQDRVFPLFNSEKDNDLLRNDLSPRTPHRPALSSRQPSYSKRYASLDSPCEVPLPSYPHSSPSSKIATTSPPHSYSLPQGVKGQRADLPSPGSSHVVGATVPAYQHELDSNGATFYSTSSSLVRSTSPSFFDLMDGIEPSLPTYTAASTSSNEFQPEYQPGGPRHTRDSSNGSMSQKALASPPMSQSQSSSSSKAGFVFPFSRPHSLPAQEHSPSSPSLRPTWSDRNSSVSLPLPMQTPYFTLPKVASGSTVDEEKEWLQFGSGVQQDVLRPTPPSVSPDQQAPKDAIFSSNAYPTSSSSSPTSLRLPIPAMALSAPSPRSLSASAISPGSLYPPPAPPTILTPPPRSEGAAAGAPYEPFLNNAPPPVDSWIAVETTQPEYRLIVRLPGFRRDAITLATRRRRVLHLVADSWEPGGGHFERRISFGYDADLNQVRAEFDGELLRVIIPRRLQPLNTWYQTPATTS